MPLCENKWVREIPISEIFYAVSVHVKKVNTDEQKRFYKVMEMLISAASVALCKITFRLWF